MDIKDQINNFKNHTEDSYWPSWKKGADKRQKIIEFLQSNPNASIEDLANFCGLSTSQIRRHRANLVASGLWKVCSLLIAIGIGIVAGAYYDETVDEFIESHITYPAQELKEDFLWQLEQSMNVL